MIIIIELYILSIKNLIILLVMNKIIQLYISSIPYLTFIGGGYGYYSGYNKNKIINKHNIKMPTYIKFGIVSGSITLYSLLGAFYPMTIVYYLYIKK